jgi:hypothetical protein
MAPVQLAVPLQPRAQVRSAGLEVYSTAGRRGFSHACTCLNENVTEGSQARDARQNAMVVSALRVQFARGWAVALHPRAPLNRGRETPANAAFLGLVSRQNGLVARHHRGGRPASSKGWSPCQ